MRLSIATKLLLSFFLVLGLSFAPAYWYLRRDLMTRVVASVEADLGNHVRLVAGRLAPVPDAQLDTAVREIGSVLVDRVSIVALDGQVIGESAVPRSAMGQLENHLDREEVQEAMRTGYGSAVRLSPTKGEPYLYVARLLQAPDGKSRGVVRLERPLGVITKSFQGAVTFLYRAFGVAATLVLVMSLGATLYTVRPLLRIRQAALAYARGEYTYPLPKPTRDEIGELGESMAELARRIQQERVSHSADAAVRSELVRMLPVPVLLLGPDLGTQEMNAPFREAAEIDPAHEHVRVHELCRSPEVQAAMAAARSAMQAQDVTVQLPWRRGTLRLLVCPLARPGGEVGWALVGATGSGAPTAAERVLARAEALLRELPHPVDPQDAVRRCELRVLLGALRPADVPRPESVAPLGLGPLLGRLLEEMEPVAAAQGTRISLEDAPSPALIADSEGRVERVLRAALWRALGALRPSRAALAAADSGLELAVHEEKTTVLLQIMGLQRAVPTSDLDQLLSPLGGGVGLTREAAEGQPSDGPATGSELWIQLRRA